MIRKLIDKLLRWILLLLLVAAGVLVYLLATESGSRNLERLAMYSLPQLAIEQASGRILGDYHVGRLAWKDAAATVVADRVNFSGVFTALLHGELVVQRLRIGKLVVDLQERQQPEPASTDAFEMPVALRLEDLSIERLEFGMSGQRYTADNLHLEGKLDGSEIDDSLLRLTTMLAGRELSLSVSGKAAISEPFAFDLESTATLADAQLGSLDVEAAMSGNLDSYGITALVEGASDVYGRNSLRLAARGDAAGLQLESAKLEGDNGEADLVGTLGWKEALSWQADLKLADVRTAMFLPDYPAVLDGALASKGQLRDGRPTFVIELRGLSGTLRDYPLSATGMASFGDGLLDVRSLEIATGDNRLQANGTAGETLDLAFELDAGKLDQLLPQLAGGLKASGTLEGTLEKPRVQAQIAGSALGYADNSIDSLELTIATEGEMIKAEGGLQQLHIGEQLVSRVDLEASGTPGEHRLALKAAHELAILSTRLDGGWQQERWQGEIALLDIDTRQAGSWTLQQPVALTASASLVESGELCLGNGEGLLCSTHRWERDKGVGSSGKASALPLALTQPFLPPSVRVNGTAGFDYALTLADGKPSGSMQLAWPAGSVLITDDTGRGKTLGFDAGKLDATLENDQLQATGGIRLPGYADIDGKAAIDFSPEDGRHSIDADLKATSKDITWLDEFIPEAQLLKGSLGATAQVTGLLAAPDVKAEARLADGQLRIDRTGETLDDITLTLQPAGENRFAIDGSLKAGKGTLRVNGELKLAGANWSTRLEIKGSQLALLDSHEIKVQVAPDILVEANQEKVVMSGSLLVPEAAIRLVTLPKSAVVESEDVVIVGSGGPQRRSPGEGLGFEPRLKVVLGEKVTFSGYGLEARLMGEFRLTQLRGKLITDGFLTIHDGLYKIYGQTLEIDSGRLIFNGPLDNPGVDIRIVRKLPDVTVGLNVSGTLQTPESSVYSTPVMSETEAFSYLLTGRSLSGASAVEGAMLMNVAKSMGLLGGESFVKKLGSGLGLDEATITTEGGFEESELLLGKRIGENLYVKYIMGIVDSVRKLALEYRFTERLRIEAETGTESSADLIYRIERD